MDEIPPPLFPRTLEGFVGASWMAEIELHHFLHMATWMSPCTVLEVGTASGSSCAWVASQCPEDSFLCVDVFKYDPEHDPERRQHFYSNQRSNMSLFSGTLEECLAANRDARFNLILVDADHSYEGCLSDLRLAAPFLEPGGTVLVHDYGCPDWPGVKKAVHQFLHETEPAFRFICVQHSLIELRKEQ
jgi:predicted O-methyltransferase YrrM